MKTQKELASDARNEDPITHEPGSHPVGVGVGTAAGAAAGGAMGAVAGPVGAAVGAIVGGVAGGLAGKAVGEEVNPTMENAYWREHHAEQTYVDSDYTFDDYAPAYRVGYEGHGRHGTDFDAADSSLQSDWEDRKGDSRLDWEKAKHAARAGWHRVEARLPGDADRDGI
jgi:hypothetical protein